MQITEQPDVGKWHGWSFPSLFQFGHDVLLVASPYQVKPFLHVFLMYKAVLFGTEELVEVELVELALHGDLVAFEDDPYRAVEGADAVAILTDWRQFADLDWTHVFALMRKPAFLFDGRNCLDHRALFDIGFHVHAIGKAPMSHFS